MNPRKVELGLWPIFTTIGNFIWSAGSTVVSATSKLLPAAISINSLIDSFKNPSTNSSIIGGGSAQETSYQHDVQVNTQHALNFFNYNYDCSKTAGWKVNYKDFLTAEEWSALAQVEAQRVAADPYYGGLGSAYSSRYVKDASGNPVLYNSVPAVGIAKDIDAYIDQKLTQQKAQETEAAKQAETVKSWVPYILIGVGTAIVAILILRRRK